MSGSPGIRRVNIRFVPDMGPEGTFTLRCDDCANRGESTAYWPLTLEYWTPYSLQRCRACQNAHKRHLQRQTIEQRRKKMRAWYWADRPHRLQYAKDYLDANREHVNEMRRGRYAKKKAARQEQAA